MYFQAMKTRELSITDLPQEVIYLLREYLAPSDVRRLASTCRFFRYQCLNSFILPYAGLVQLLLVQVMRGNEAGVRMILAHDAGLLLEKNSVDHYPSVTALQLAFDLEDPEMCVVLREYFDRLPDGRHHALNQLNEWDAKNIASRKLFYSFSVIADYIKQSTNDHVAAEYSRFWREDFERSDLSDNMDNFRNSFESHAKTNSGGCIDVGDLIRALHVFKTTFSGCAWDKRDLYLTQVFSFVLRFASMRVKQAFAQGRAGLRDQNAVLVRSHEFVDHMRGRHSLLNVEPFEGLGFDFDMCADIRSFCAIGDFNSYAEILGYFHLMLLSKLAEFKSSLQSTPEVEPDLKRLRY